jgi:hypothetical protein
MVPVELIVKVTDTPGVKPLPEAVAVTPDGPCVGSSVRVGVVMRNAAVAASKLPSDPVAVSV